MLREAQKNFQQRLDNVSYVRDARPHDRNIKTHEIYYDNKDKKLFDKYILNDGRVQYSVPDENKRGRAVFTDYDNDGNIDNFVHMPSKIEGYKAWDVKAVDKNDDGTFDNITYRPTKFAKPKDNIKHIDMNIVK